MSAAHGYYKVVDYITAPKRDNSAYIADEDTDAAAQMQAAKARANTQLRLSAEAAATHAARHHTNRSDPFTYGRVYNLVIRGIFTEAEIVGTYPVVSGTGA